MQTLLVLSNKNQVEQGTLRTKYFAPTLTVSYVIVEHTIYMQLFNGSQVYEMKRYYDIIISL